MAKLYAHLRPSELQAALAAGAPAVLALGALEWHGEHLPLGLDGLVAESFAAHLSERLEGVLLPAVWLPMTTLPHPYSMQISSGLFRSLIDELLLEIGRVGFAKAVLVTGHYAQGHMVELYRAALASSVPTYAGSPLELLGDPSLLDHAARYEASQLLHLDPGLVRLDLLPPEPGPSQAVLGEDPRHATAEEGAVLTERALEAWTTWVRAPLATDHYEEAMNQYQVYERLYRQDGTWERAIERWWQERIR